MDDYYGDVDLWRAEARGLQPVHIQSLGILERLLDGLSGSRPIADIGAGDGLVLKHLLAGRSAPTGYAVDFSENALAEVPDELNPTLADVRSLPFADGFFELSFCIDVLEHLPLRHVGAAIAEARRVTTGPTLFVSPYCESTAVRTRCPECGTVFSPYNHLTRFDLEVWESLLPPVEARTYFPLGLAKPRIPESVASVILAHGLYAVHSHHAMCPQCRLRFVSEHEHDDPTLGTFLAPFTAAWADFGWDYEELGVLVGADSEPNVPTEPSIRVASARPSVRLAVTSAAGIDFSDGESVRLSADIFRSPAYGVKTDVKVTVDRGGCRVAALEGGRSLILRIALPPRAVAGSALSLELENSVAGVLELARVDPYGAPVRLAMVELEPGAHEVRFEVGAAEPDPTPYGVLIDVLWEPAGRQGGEVLFRMVNDLNRPTQTYELSAGVWVPAPTIESHLQVTRVLSSDETSSVTYAREGRIYDLSPHLRDSGGAVAIPPPPGSEPTTTPLAAITDELVRIHASRAETEDSSPSVAERPSHDDVSSEPSDDAGS